MVRTAAILVAALALCCSGCARLLAPILAPQEAALSTASQVADRAALSGVGREVDRLLGAGRGDPEELKRIKELLGKRLNGPERDGSALAEIERLRPWHPRAAEADPAGRDAPRPDTLRVIALQTAERGTAAPGPLPDGIPAGERFFQSTPIRMSRGASAP